MLLDNLMEPLNHGHQIITASIGGGGLIVATLSFYRTWKLQRQQMRLLLRPQDLEENENFRGRDQDKVAKIVQCGEPRNHNKH